MAKEGRGVWYWNNATYTVLKDEVYKGSNLIYTFSTITGPCGGLVVRTPDERLFICDGIDGITIDKYDNIENVEKAYLRWSTSTIVEYGDKRVPTILNGYYYTATAVTVNSETGASEPTWPTTIGNTVVDNDVTWTCTGTTTFTRRANSTAYVANDIIVPATENSLWYKCIVAGTSGGSIPTYPTVQGETVTDGTVTWECGGYYGGFPSPHIPQPIGLDGYLCLAEKDSIDMYNSWINNVFSWNPLDFISAESFSDPIRGLARQNNYIVLFGDISTEMLYNNNTETGSPFIRNESFLLQHGIRFPYSIMQEEKFCMWVGKSDAGQSAVWQLDGFSAKEVSTEFIERILNAETDTDNVYGYSVRVDGHFFYILNLPTINKTLVYDIDLNLWHEWSYDNSAFPYNFKTTKDLKVLLLHKDNGRIYELTPTQYTDAGVNIDVSAITSKIDFGSDKRKFYHKIEVVGDLVPSTLDVSWTDDDYQTWSNVKTLDLSERPYFMRGGVSRRRAFKLNHSDNTPLRLEFLECIYTQGEH